MECSIKAADSSVIGTTDQLVKQLWLQYIGNLRRLCLVGHTSFVVTVYYDLLTAVALCLVMKLQLYNFATKSWPSLYIIILIIAKL